ncbi:hypothetical protein F5148DRAFT_935399 [Russula earlei]|uniref:Uncharacterized protein n=1 Tax=Russula earlei TaxID=71964 RepID=A0ACC0U979_9AGAM|nr:hypothetical protein F5148DRAFT_935399 [Russula earlei]
MPNAPSTDEDSWDPPFDDDSRNALYARHKAIAPSSAVPDDWDQAPSSGEEDNRRIWDNANDKAPMPQLVVTSTRTGSVSSVVPPATAFQPPIRILKRSAAPTQQCASDDSPATASTSGSFAERSARYNAARERIFAGAAESASLDEGGVGQISAIVRNPKGPENTQGPNGQGKEGSQGFGARARKRGSSHQQNENQERRF